MAATRDHDVWLITHTANAAVIEPLRAADAHLRGRLHPEYVSIGGRAERLRFAGPLRFLYYAAWQLGPCRRAARRLHRHVGMDVCHHVTYAADWLPAGVSRTPSLPFIWGPVGGSSSRPGVGLQARLGVRTLASEITRLALLTPLRRTVGRRLAARAAHVFGQNADVTGAFAPIPVTVEPHVAVEPHGAVECESRPAAAHPRAVYAGRLLGWKGIRLALAALRRPAAAAWHLDLYGAGPQRRYMERLVTRWALGNRVRFLGQRPRAEVRAALEAADAFLFPSVHDAAGWAVAEALAAGCPVVALRLGGPATLVGPGDGILVDPRGDVVAGLADALDNVRTLRPRRDAWSAARLPDLVTALYERYAPTAAPTTSTGDRR
jgi:glycosyltransferase involved in cell wall biosynthesis